MQLMWAAADHVAISGETQLCLTDEYGLVDRLAVEAPVCPSNVSPLGAQLLVS